jgi:hypothetical protein
MRHNTKMRIFHEIIYKATKTIKDTLHAINTTQKSKAMPATGRRGL